MCTFVCVCLKNTFCCAPSRKEQVCTHGDLKDNLLCVESTEQFLMCESETKFLLCGGSKECILMRGIHRTQSDVWPRQRILCGPSKKESLCAGLQRKILMSEPRENMSSILGAHGINASAWGLTRYISPCVTPKKESVCVGPCS